MRLRDLAARLQCQLEGPEDLEITGVAGMDEASSSELTFLANPKYLPKLKSTRAAAIIVGPDDQAPGRSLLRSDNPYLAFAKAAELFHPPERPPAGLFHLRQQDAEVNRLFAEQVDDFGPLVTSVEPDRSGGGLPDSFDRSFVRLRPFRERSIRPAARSLPGATRCLTDPG